MTYTVEDRDETNSAVYDGPVYIGLVVNTRDSFRASKAGTDDEVVFTDKGTAVEWLVAEHRDVPWADRSVGARK